MVPARGFGRSMTALQSGQQPTYIIKRRRFSNRLDFGSASNIYIYKRRRRLENGDRKGDIGVRVRADRGDVADGRPRQYAVVHTSRGGDPTNWGNLTRNMMSFIW